jgi:hypothetical protein
MNSVTLAFAATLLVWAMPTAAQFDAEGMGLRDELSNCIQKHAFEEDDGLKLPESIADRALAMCESKWTAFEAYLVRHSVNMDKARDSLRKVDRDMAVKFVLLNRKAGLIDASNQ